jgi:hypothetical protein
VLDFTFFRGYFLLSRDDISWQESATDVQHIYPLYHAGQENNKGHGGRYDNNIILL